MQRRLTASLLALSLGLAACGGDDEQEIPAQPAATATPAETPSEPADVEQLASKISDDLSEKPQIPAPEGAPPGELVTEDLVEGDGKTAKAGSEVTVQYVGASWSNGQEFDASWDRGEPFTLQLGAGQVIPGWEAGLEGARVGGRRLLVIPPDQGYGAQGSPPVIGPDETLVFVVDIEDVS